MFKLGIDFCYDIYYIYVMTKKEEAIIISPRTGRPTDNPKSYRESFRFSDSDIKKLDYCVKETGMSKVDVIRRGIDLVYEQLIKK